MANILQSELKNKKGKYGLLTLEIITERIYKLPYFRKQNKSVNEIKNEDKSD